MGLETKPTYDETAARLRGLLDTLGLIAKTNPRGDMQSYCDQLRGAVEVLDHLAGVWPDADDGKLVQHATEIVQSEAAIELLMKALAGGKKL